MFAFLALLTSTLAVPDDLGTTLMAIKKLHSTTPYSTFYEIFGTSESSSLDTIRKRYQAMMKSPKPIAGVKSRTEAVALLTEAYNILKNRKSTYDFILSNSYMYLGNKENFRNHLYMLLFSSVVALLAFDLLCFGIRYLRFLAAQPGKKKKARMLQKPTMLTLTIVHAVASIIKR